MRANAWLIAALLIMFLPAPVVGQAPVALLNDAGSDVQLTAEGNPTGDPAAAAAADLLALSVEEQADNLLLRLDLAASPQDGTFGVSTSTRFRVTDTVYEVQTFLASPTFANTFGNGQNAFASLRVVGSDGDSDYLTRLEIALEGASQVITVPREMLLDSNGAAPFPGMAIDGWNSRADIFQMNGGELRFGPAGSYPAPTVTYGDRMPDAGNGTLPLEIALGVAQTGHARLFAPIPMRASNGEATTFVYELEAQNRGTQEDTFEIITVGAPAEWDVQVPINTVALEPGANFTVPVLVSTPFNHEHGAARTFLVEMHSITDRSAIGRVEVGVRYNAIPQPAGHHDTLFLHSVADDQNEFELVFGTVFGFDNLDLVMNAAENYEGATNQAVPAWTSGNYKIDGSDVEFGSATWFIPLGPGLEMGLDFQTDGEGTITIPVETVVPLPQARLSGMLVHLGQRDDGGQARVWDDEGRTVLAHVNPTEAVDMSANHVFETTITPTPQSDLIVFEENAQLVLQLNLTYLRPEAFFGPGDKPAIKGGSLRLPLNEYRDPVDDLFASIGNLALHADTAQDRLVNPGHTAIYRFRVMDHGGAHGSYSLELTGPNSKWATILEGSEVRIERNDAAAITVLLAVPETAADGDLADIVLQVTNKADPTLRTIARFAAEVDTDATHEDEAQLALELQGLAEAKKDTPGVALVVLLAALALIAARRR